MLSFLIRENFSARGNSRNVHAIYLCFSSCETSCISLSFLSSLLYDSNFETRTPGIGNGRSERVIGVGNNFAGMRRRRRRGGTAAFVSAEKNLGPLDNGSHAGFRAVNKLDSLKLRYSRIEQSLRRLTPHQRGSRLSRWNAHKIYKARTRNTNST